jgi:hypothetical protein
LEENLKMSRSSIKTLTLPVAIAVVAAVALTGCGGGGGGGGSPANGVLISVSFVGFFPVPGTSANIPAVFRDQALEFQFDGPLDDPILGGYFSQNGVPVEFGGVPPAGTLPIPYFAFADQFAAKTSLQIWQNDNTMTQLASYVVGRHRDKPDTIVLDPRVSPGHPMGLPVNDGFKTNQVYAFIIPPNNSFLFGGQSAQPAGPSVFTLPVPIPNFTTQPALSGLFLSGGTFGPDPVPPAVVSIQPASGAAGTDADPMLQQDPIRVTFSKAVTSASIDPLKNFIVRNINITSPSFPNGAPVPGSVAPSVVGATSDTIYIFTPSAPYGPGVGGNGFQIEVRVGDIPYPQPNAVVPPILGVPTGLSGTQLEISNSLSTVLRSTPCTGCQTPGSIVEGFDNSTFLDSSFVQTFGPVKARWNDASATSQLAGRVISGAPSPQAFGTRQQFEVNPTPPTTTPFAGLFTPFDASAANSMGQCGTGGCNLGAGINPNGGGHIMHIYEYGEGMMNVEDSLEQIEWSSPSGVTAPTVYPQYSIWCGVSNIVAPLSGGTQTGLNTVFDSNYTLLPYQTGIPTGMSTNGPCGPPTLPGARKVPCGLNQTYTVALQTTQFYPFPLLNPCFDYSRDTGVSGMGTNLLFEQNIEPGMQAPNFNRYRATNFIPVRRLIDGPLSMVPASVCPFNHGGTFDVYRARFTFVGLVAQTRSLWYDTGTANPGYLEFIVTPPATSQPLGTQSTWILEGTDTNNPGPSTIGSSGVYINAQGQTFPQVLTGTGTGQIGQLRYFRFRIEFRANNVGNTTPAYTSVVMAYLIP